MISNTNNRFDQSETLAQVYEVFLYKKKDIIAIQEKLSINGNANNATTHQSKTKHEPEGKTLKNLDIDGNPILAVEWYNNGQSPESLTHLANQSNKASTDLPLSKLYNLLLYLEEDIMAIQEELGIVGYTNQEMVDEADKNARAYLQKFEKFHGPLEDVPSVILQKFSKMGLKKMWFTGEGLPLFPNVSPQQLHEVFVKKSASTHV
ncbi:4880_t:CDS:2 [Entrophospora sp. SA101]|nr:3523_t:CDS:2 [Entrophospora sp. SA101]CAJ0874687.1 4880_t:CDS:2 [Entrophospora sp. SA101]